MNSDNQYIKIERWMTTLGLNNTTDLMLFALIHGYPKHQCYCSLKTLSEWLLVEKQTVLDSLDRLQGIDPSPKKKRSRKKERKFPPVIWKEEKARGKGHVCIYTSLVVHSDEKIKYITPPNDNTAQNRSEALTDNLSDKQTDNLSDKQTDNLSDYQTGLISRPDLSDNQTASSLIIRHNNTTNNNDTTAAAVSYSLQSIKEAVMSVCGAAILQDSVIGKIASMLIASADSNINVEGYVAYVYDYATKHNKGNLSGYFASIIALPSYLHNYLCALSRNRITPLSEHSCPICGYMHKDSDIECPQCHNTRDTCNGDAHSLSIAKAEWKLHQDDPTLAAEYDEHCSELIASFNPAMRQDHDRQYSIIVDKYLGRYLENPA